MKVISVPLSHDAMLRLDINENFKGDLLELELEDAWYYNYISCSHNIFVDIKHKVGIDIDDYEDTSISGNKLFLLRSILEKNYDILALKLLPMVEVAISKKTGIFFFF